MTDSELIEEFIRVERTDAEIRLLVRKIDWEGRPYDPVSRWEDGTSLPPTATDAEIQKASAQLLEDPIFFSRCTECNERNPDGWMHDDRICQGCAQRNHGIVYSPPSDIPPKPNLS